MGERRGGGGKGVETERWHRSVKQKSVVVVVNRGPARAIAERERREEDGRGEDSPLKGRAYCDTVYEYHVGIGTPSSVEPASPLPPRVRTELRRFHRTILCQI